jgi:hypothetical protein
MPLYVRHWGEIALSFSCRCTPHRKSPILFSRFTVSDAISMSFQGVGGILGHERKKGKRETSEFKAL